MPRSPHLRAITSLVAGLLLSTGALAQSPAVPAQSSAPPSQVKVVRVMSSEGAPIPYASVTVNGGTVRITDQQGELSLGAGAIHTITLNVRRIGYKQWFGTLQLSDTTRVIAVTLPSLAQSLSAVNVTGTAGKSQLELAGFYDRWMMREKGTLSAVFIGPEELEFRHPDKVTGMLRGLNGVMLKRSCEGEQVAFSLNGTCQMTILVDGTRQCPGQGCNIDVSPSARDNGRNCDSSKLLDGQTAVLIDRVLDANDVAAIEVYDRGGNMPVSLQADDSRCGVIAFWTGSRH